MFYYPRFAIDKYSRCPPSRSRFDIKTAKVADAPESRCKTRSPGDYWSEKYRADGSFLPRAKSIGNFEPLHTISRMKPAVSFAVDEQRQINFPVKSACSIICGLLIYEISSSSNNYFRCRSFMPRPSRAHSVVEHSGASSALLFSLFIKVQCKFRRMILSQCSFYGLINERSAALFMYTQASRSLFLSLSRRFSSIIHICARKNLASAYLSHNKTRRRRKSRHRRGYENVNCERFCSASWVLSCSRRFDELQSCFH